MTKMQNSAAQLRSNRTCCNTIRKLWVRIVDVNCLISKKLSQFYFLFIFRRQPVNYLPRYEFSLPDG